MGSGNISDMVRECVRLNPHGVPICRLHAQDFHVFLQVRFPCSPSFLSLLVQFDFVCFFCRPISPTPNLYSTKDHVVGTRDEACRRSVLLISPNKSDILFQNVNVALIQVLPCTSSDVVLLLVPLSVRSSFLDDHPRSALRRLSGARRSTDWDMSYWRSHHCKPVNGAECIRDVFLHKNYVVSVFDQSPHWTSHRFSPIPHPEPHLSCLQWCVDVTSMLVNSNRFDEFQWFLQRSGWSQFGLLNSGTLSAFNHN